MLIDFKKAVWVGLLVSGMGASVPGFAGAQEQEAIRKITRKVTPVYPAIAKQARMTGAVKLTLVVAADGTVKSVKTTGGNPLFVVAAEDAVKRWQFEAAKKESTESIVIKFESPQ